MATKRRAKWSKREIIAKIKLWHATTGEIPAATDFNPGDCRRSARISAARSARWLDRANIWESGEFPWAATVQRTFGSWNAAITAAGFEPRRSAMVVLEGIGDLEQGLDSIRGLSESLTESKDDPERLRSALVHLAERALAVASEIPEG